uniref:Uncharacterized protein n=1 Tax=Chromera velia CCMP2878 TaxID=1169474 RepID=A0A0G4HBX5_9ALVE|eukprot:Cvel_6263.t1-p1 / transcript=Cvel_6263.t1 / gene=Cvel_6263 / organism=Chromera_velia_CCMP2878 / gene_product=hypothetical protein / transcript_product=hypothetical protein / location=Cvel_scaffold303:83627-86228(-) / protein_length=829 / sequence_SO=supercontig / SO=protein_coding / is_pseudo=false
MDSPSPENLLLRVLDFQDGALTFLPLCSSVPSVVLQLICKAFQRATVDVLADTEQGEATSKTSVNEEIVSGAPNLNLALWGEDTSWTEEEVRSAANLVAICDGAVEGGHADLLRSTLDVLVPNTLAQPRLHPRWEGHVQDGKWGAVGEETWTHWLKEALVRGYWRVRSTLLEFVREMDIQGQWGNGSLTPLSAYDGGAAFLPFDVLPQHSRLPLADLEGALLQPLSVRLANGVFVREGVRRRLLLQALRADVEDITSNPFPVSTDHPPPREMGALIRLVGLMMSVAVVVGHPLETVRRIFEWATDAASWPPPQVPPAAAAAGGGAVEEFERLPKAKMLPEVFEQAVIRGDLDLMDWLVSLAPNLISVAAQEEHEFGDAFKHASSDSRMKILQWAETKHPEFLKRVMVCVTSHWLYDFEKSDAVSAAVEKGGIAAVRFIEERSVELTGRPLRLTEVGGEMCFTAWTAREWEMLRYLRAQDEPYKWGTKCRFLNESRALRNFQVDFLRAVEQNPLANPPEPPADAQGPLRDHIEKLLKNPESCSSIFNPFDWVDNWMNVPVALWLVQKGAEDAKGLFDRALRKQVRNADISTFAMVLFHINLPGIKNTMGSLGCSSGFSVLRQLGAAEVLRRMEFESESFASFCALVQERCEGVDIVKKMRECIFYDNFGPQPAWRLEKIFERWGRGSLRAWVEPMLEPPEDLHEDPGEDEEDDDGDSDGEGESDEEGGERGGRGRGWGGRYEMVRRLVAAAKSRARRRALRADSGDEEEESDDEDADEESENDDEDADEESENEDEDADEESENENEEGEGSEDEDEDDDEEDSHESASE